MKKEIFYYEKRNEKWKGRYKVNYHTLEIFKIIIDQKRGKISKKAAKEILQGT